jgi:hypothetical protein
MLDVISFRYISSVNDTNLTDTSKTIPSNFVSQNKNKNPYDLRKSLISQTTRLSTYAVGQIPVDMTSPVSSSAEFQNRDSSPYCHL